MLSRAKLVTIAALFVWAALPAGADRPHPLEISERDLISRTILKGNVLGGPERETIVLAEFLTGKRSGKGTIGIRVAVYPEEWESAKPLWSRDYGEAFGDVARGELSILDIDDRAPEDLMVSFRSDDPPGTRRTIGELLRDTGGGLSVAWSGPLKLDTSGPESPVPAGERERFIRELDYERTSATRGGMVVFRKTIWMAAGVPIDPPRTIEESIPLDAP